MREIENVTLLESLRGDKLQQIFKDNDISPLSSWLSSVGLVDGIAGETRILQLDEAIRLPREELLRKPLIMISNTEGKTVDKKKEGRKRPSREEKQIRSDYKRIKDGLLQNGPGAVLASIVINSGGKAKWSEGGLVGVEEKWKLPSDEERSWWGLIYDLKQNEFGVEEVWEDQLKGKILWSFFVMRFRLRNGSVSREKFDSFLSSLVNVVSENDERLQAYLREINQRLAN